VTKADGTDLDATDHTAFVNNFLHSLFSQCSVALNNASVTQTIDLYNYRDYLETLHKYGRNAANTHFTNAYWYIDSGDVVACYPKKADSKNKLFIRRCERCKQLKVQLHADFTAIFVMCHAI
jgi:hypothetical protein